MYDDAGDRLDVFSHEGEPLGEALGIDTITVTEYDCGVSMIQHSIG